MIKVLLLLLHAGLSLALQFPLEYKYDYQGSVFTGIPEIHKQASAVSLIGNLIAQVHQDGSVLMTLDEVTTEISEHHGETGCTNEEFPGPFRQLKDDKLKKILSAPFRAHLFDGNDSALEVSKEENVAISNIKKAIVSVFRNVLLNSNFEGSSGIDTVAHRIRLGDVPPVFIIQEESIFGICNVEYTVHKLPEHLAGSKNYMLEKEMGVDVQRDVRSSDNTKKPSPKKKTSKYSKKKKYTKKPITKSSDTRSKIPAIKDDLWHVVKSIDFDNCQESVILQDVKLVIENNPAVGQYDSLGGRSSVTEYIIRGSGGAFRIERASIQGVYLQTPYGPQAEAMQVKTDQTFKLKATYLTTELLQLPHQTKTRETWMHEFDVASNVPEISKPIPWMHYTGEGPQGIHDALYGFSHADVDVTMKINLIVEIVQNISKEMVDTHGGHEGDQALNMIHFVKYLITDLSKGEIKELLRKIMVETHTPQEKLARKLIVDILVTHGFGPHVDVVLELIEEGEIGELQELSIYITALHYMQKEHVLKFLDHILKIDLDEKPFLGSTALINVIGVLRQSCIDDIDLLSIFKSPEEVNCRVKIKNELFPYIKSLIFEEAHWKKVLGLSALRELRTPFALQVVPSIIFGKHGEDLTLSKVAVTLLERWNIPSVVRNQAMVLLEKVQSDVALHPQLRQAALYALVSWNPEAHFFYKLARSTWHEPSKDMIIFKNSLLQALATNTYSNSIKQNQAASHAVKFIRPISPSMTFRHSLLMRDIKDQLHHRFLEIKENMWIKTEDTESSHSTYYFKTVLNGISLEMMKMYRFMTLPSMPSRSNERESADQIAKRIASALYDKIQDSVRAETNPQESNQISSDIYLSFLKHMKLYIPMNLETAGTLFFTDRTFQQTVLMKAIAAGYETYLAKFLIPVQSFAILPTDIGMPLLSWMSVLDMFSVQSIATIDSAGKFSDEFAYREIFQVSFGLQVSSVLTNTLIGTSIRTSAQINIPLSISASVQHISFESPNDKKFIPVSAESYPVTYVLPLPMIGVRAYEEKIIEAFEPKDALRKFSFFGIDTEVLWTSQLSSPMALVDPAALANFPGSYDILRPQTMKRWRLAVYFDPEQSQTRNISISWKIYQGEKKPEPDDDGQQTGQVSQYGQEEGEFGQYGQEAGQVGQEPDDFGQTGEFGPQHISEVTTVSGGHIFSNIVIGESHEDRHIKLKAYLDEGTNVYSLRIDGHGSTTRTVEYIFATPNRIIANSRQKTQKHLALLRTSIPGIDEKPLKICFDFSKVEPKLSRLSTLNSVLASKLASEMTLTMVEDCEGTPLISLKNKAVMTSEAKDLVQTYLSGKECSGAPLEVAVFPYVPIAGFHLDTHFVYNEVRYEVEWQKIDDSARYPVTTAVTDHLGYFLSLTTGEHLCSNDKSPGKMTAGFERCPCGKWKITSGSDFKLEVQQPIINSFLDLKNTIRGTRKIIDYITPSSNAKCIITDKSVTTMIGNTYEFHPTSCWTVAMMDCSNADHWMILVKEDRTERGIPEIRYVNKKTAVTVEIGKSIRVNGAFVDPISESEEIRDDEDHFIATVYKNDEASLVEVREVSIAITDKVIITVKTSPEESCGLCGNKRSIMEDMIGPKKCIYGDPKLFAEAWAGPSDQCDLYTIMGVRSKAETYQEACTTLEGAHEKSLSEYPDEGMVVGWRLHQEQEYYCVSDMPLGHCQKGFESFSESMTPVDFKCYRKDRCPRAISAALDHNEEFIDFPVEGRPWKHQKIMINLADFCRKVNK